jgi:ankyrin repeat protein
MKRIIVLGLLGFGIAASAMSEDCGALCDDRYWETATKESIRELIADGADVNATDGLGGTPLHWAASHSNPDGIEVLLNAGANINALDENEWTPLELAIFFGLPESVTTLWVAGANVNTNSLIGWNALHLAALLGSPESVTALLKVGVDGTVKNNDGDTPFDLAQFNDRVIDTEAYLALGDARFTQP